MHDELPVSVNLQALIGLFYAKPEKLGVFTEVQAAQMPATYQKLLAHDKHMTVTVEAHHQDQVDVIVLDRTVTDTHYARKILLCRQRDHVVVQYGIMRINFAYLPAEVRAEIEKGETPLGRILIEHNVLRSVQLVSLWRVVPGPELAHFFGIDLKEVQARGGPPPETYGRTAIIFCNEEPAVELLEIVTPAE